MLLAVGVFALVAAIAYGGLAHIVKQQSHLQQKSSRSFELQTAVALITRELQQALPRASWSKENGIEAAMIATNRPARITFWRQTDQLDSATISLLQISYELIGDTLWRVERPLWSADQTPQRFALLRQVTSLQWRFLDKERVWNGQWPPQNLALTSMPAAIELHISSTGNMLFSAVVMGYGSIPK
jgi:general secretion pathway protein J